MMNKVEVNSIGPIGILWAAFIIMKVMHLIDWSWLIVIMWPASLAAVVLLFLSGCYAATKVTKMYA